MTTHIDPPGWRRLRPTGLYHWAAEVSRGTAKALCGRLDAARPARPGCTVSAGERCRNCMDAAARSGEVLP